MSQIPIAFTRDQLALITRDIQQRQRIAFTGITQARRQRCEHMVRKFEAAADFCEEILQRIEDALQAEAPAGFIVFITAGAEQGGELLRRAE